MIGYLRGIVRDRSPARLILDVHGVGYIVHVPLTVDAHPGDEVELHIHTHVTDSQITLYGFADDLQRQLFEQMLKVQGVGPRIALSVLSHMPPDEFLEVIRRREVRRLREIPGIGSRVSERLVVEMAPLVQRYAASAAPSEAASTVDPAKIDEILQALLSLGYKKKEVESLVRETVQRHPDAPIEELLRRILREKAR